MSNYHILQSTPEGHEVQVVFHIVVPDENNKVNINLRTALVQYQPFIKSSVPWILETDAEFIQLKAGELYEYVETVCYNGNFALIQKRDICDARYTQLINIIQNRIRAALCFWGLNRNVV